MRISLCRRSKSFTLVWAVIVVSSVLIQPALAITPLDEYVNAIDSSYTWTLQSTIPGTDYTAYVIDLTSQTWRSSSEVNPTQWQHWLTVIKPDTVNYDYDKAMLVIDGGGNGDAAPGPSDEEVLLGGVIATATNSVIAYLGMVPNQPLTFTGQPPRSEDALIAYSWDQYMQSYLGGSPDGYWPAQLPMVKSAVQAMTAVQEFCVNPTGETWSLTIDDFVVGGASKRGWATWLTAAVDSRVTAIAPMVIDILNVEESLKHHYETYGFWSPAVDDYVDMGIMNHVDTPELKALMDIVDPYEYRDRLTMPKYMINSTGDEFFLPDSSQFYFDDLSGEKYLRYVPNTSHSLEQEFLDVATSLTVFYQAQLDGLDLPDFSWTLDEDGQITIDTTDTPLEVNLWQATNSSARDFRYDTIGEAWSSSLLTDQGGGIYIADVSTPAEGWTAFFAELIFDSGLGAPYKFTTQVMVVPEPATMLLLTLASATLLAVRRRR